jgi:FtsZ-binding cell division protein ZapB
MTDLIFGLNFQQMIGIGSAFGIPGLIILIWWMAHRMRIEEFKQRDQQFSTLLKENRQHIDTVLEKRDNDLKDTLCFFQKRIDVLNQQHQKTLEAYANDMTKIKRFYENNVELVKSYDKMSGELTSIIHLNTQTMTHLHDAIKNNSFCPLLKEQAAANIRNYHTVKERRNECGG